MYKPFAAILGTALALSPLLGQAADANGANTLRLYNWSDYIGEHTIADFEKATGIKVVYDTYDSYETVQGKLLPGRSGYDLVVLNAALVPPLLKAGVFQPLDKSRLPSWNNLDPEVLKHLDHYDPGVQYSAPYTWGSNGITYNIDKIKQRMPDAPIGSLAMLFDPKVVSKFADCGVTIIDSPTDVIPWPWPTSSATRTAPTPRTSRPPRTCCSRSARTSASSTPPATSTAWPTATSAWP